MEYAFHIYNKLAADGISMATDQLLRRNARQKNDKTRGAGLRSPQNMGEDPFDGTPPVVVCVGSDLAIGDSLGPITGSMLKFKTQGLRVFLYGTLSAPVTAKEIGYMRTFLKETHVGSQVIAVDAAVGEEGDIGLMKLNDKPLLPGAGANKKLGALGDVSVLGVVAEKSVANYGLLNTTRLNLVYTMAEILSDGIAALLWERCNRQEEKQTTRFQQQNA
ncbi:MAG: spore protease YyaC [Clostridia bacterium]|nr:spore protease YyaC [Clostridia bacterium]